MVWYILYFIIKKAIYFFSKQKLNNYISGLNYGVDPCGLSPLLASICNAQRSHIGVQKLYKFYRRKFLPELYKQNNMATGGIFQLITNDGKQDRMLMASELLRTRLEAITAARRGNPAIPDPTPTLLDIEKTHIMFCNAHFKPFNQKLISC